MCNLGEGIYEHGWKDGIEQGIEQGADMKQQELVWNSYKKGSTLEVISKVMDIPMDVVKSIVKGATLENKGN